MNETGRMFIAHMVLKFQHEANLCQLYAARCDLNLPDAEGSADLHRAGEAMYSTCAAALVKLLESNFEGSPEPDVLLETLKTSLASMAVEIKLPKDVLTRMN